MQISIKYSSSNQQLQLNSNQHSLKNHSSKKNNLHDKLLKNKISTPRLKENKTEISNQYEVKDQLLCDSIQCALVGSIIENKFSYRFIFINLLLLLIVVTITLFILQMAMKHLTGVNDGVIEFISDNTIFRMFPAKRLANYEYPVYASQPNEWQSAGKSTSEVNKHVLDDIQSEDNIKNNMLQGYSVQKLAQFDFCLFYLAITITIYIASLKIYLLLDEAFSYFGMMTQYPRNGVWIFLLGAWLLFVCLAIFWTSVQFISSNVDIVNCIVRTVGMVFISTIDDYAFQILIVIPGVELDVSKQSKMHHIQWLQYQNTMQYFTRVCQMIVSLQMFIIPLYQFIRRIMKFNNKRDNMVEIGVNRVPF